MRYLIVCLFIGLLSCAKKKEKPIEVEEVSLGVERKQDYPELLSEWGLFKTPMHELAPASDRIFSYEINAPLFSDYAHKARLVKLPEEGKIGYHGTEVLDFPEETILIKNFYYPSDFGKPEGDRRIIETRLLINEPEGWKAIVYKWNEEQTDAERVLIGAEVPVEWVDAQGVLQRINYTIPSQPQCKSCHDLGGKMTPIGPSARQLNKDKQLLSWMKAGYLEDIDPASLPRLVDYSNSNASLDSRARAWLETNCAHCHRREGPAKNSGLYLLASQKNEYRLGVNKPPIAAGKGSGGLKYSIVPGEPDKSILVHRIESLEPGEMMPELGRKMKHEEGVALIREWITEMR